MLSWDGYRLPGNRPIPGLEGLKEMTDLDWPVRLRCAVETLESSSSAPDWLKWAVRDALGVARALAPVPEAVPVPQDFVYPH
jgi:hypothetical protein